MSNIEVVGLGALNMDHLYQVERILDDGEATVSESLLSPGGSAANTIYGLAKLGVNTGFIGVIGDDDEGRKLVQDLESVGVDVSQIRTKPAKTGSVICLSDKSGRRSLYVLPGANSLLARDDLDLAYINQARMLHLSSFADDRQFQPLLEISSHLKSSIQLSFAPGMLYVGKGLKALSPILARTHVLFLNRDEILRLTGKEIVDGAEVCLEQGVHIVVVTLGRGMKLESGWKTRTAVAYIRNSQQEYIIEPSSQDTVLEVDTTGAGDAFAAGFLYGLFRGKGLMECGRLGNVLALFAITQPGARRGLPTLVELTQRYRELHPKQK